MVLIEQHDHVHGTSSPSARRGDACRPAAVYLLRRRQMGRGNGTAQDDDRAEPYAEQATSLQGRPASGRTGMDSYGGR